VYNERAVIERLIDAACALDVPRDRLEIQVLDDSTDETTAIATAIAARHRARGVNVTVLHRARRDGFKAGALAAGLERAHGEIIAVFDADFVPATDFLRRVVGRFEDPHVGMVQTRWDHLNRGQSPLTAAQAVMLDSHFLLEHTGRMAAGLFFNFNGTAGVWRRACIEDAGGWTHDTLTEDLDLSYRAQLRGWSFVFDPTVRAPAELPGDIHALKSQQRRWAKGSIQTARKLLPAVWRSTRPRRVKIEAFIHLTSNVTYPLLLVLGLLLLPVIWMSTPSSPTLALAFQVVVLVLAVAPVVVFLLLGQWLAGRRGIVVVRDVAMALVLGVGMSVTNTRAVIEGLGTSVGAWERTPKTGCGGRSDRARLYRAIRSPDGWIEVGLAAFFMLVAGLAVRAGHTEALPFVTLLLLAFGWVGAMTLHTATRHGRSATD